jgi:hypothetical protein
VSLEPSDAIASTEPRSYREEAIRRALATDPRVHLQSLEVSIVGDKVIVRGVVPDESRRAAVGSVLREAVGKGHFENLTEPADFPPPQSQERVR